MKRIGIEAAGGRRAAARAAAAVALALTTATMAAPADACCPAFAPDSRVAIADQEILIVWDAERGLEHFVRRAAFDAASRDDFGFLVPTPTKPTLSEAPNAVFDALRTATKPVPRVHYEPAFMPLLMYPLLLTFGRDAKSAAAPEEPVRVLDRQSVAGYDAVVLEADDAEALARWLREHGYDARPEIAEWAKPYILARWKITAFKYAAAQREAGVPVATGAVSLSFATDRALFPYRVPTDQLAKPGAGHTLRVYFAGDTRVDGALGAAGSAWAGAVQYANQMDGLPALLAGAAPAESLAKATWLTVLEDRTWPGGTDDLFFTRARDASPVVPTYRRSIEIPVPVDVVAVAGFAGFWIRRRRRRKREGTPSR